MFGGKEGDALGGGGGGAGLEDDLAAFAVLAFRDDALAFEDLESGAEGVASDLEAGGESAFAREGAGELALLDHFP